MPRKAAPRNQQKTPAAAPTPAEAARKSVLVIDADEGALRDARAFLESEGYEVHGVRDPIEGLRIAREGRVRLVLVDISLAEMDGYQVCKSLATDFRTCHTPVAFLTHRTEPADRLLGFLAGGADYIAKPFTRESIVQGVHKLLRG